MSDRLTELQRYQTSLFKPVEVMNGMIMKLATEPVTRADGSRLVIWHYPEYAVYKFCVSRGTSMWGTDEVRKAGGGSVETGIDRIGNLYYNHAYFPESGPGVIQVLQRIGRMVKQLSEPSEN